jgi:hypothetical protein
MVKLKSKINGGEKSHQLQISPSIKFNSIRYMNKRNFPKLSLMSPLISSGLKLSVTVIIVLMVISSPVLMLANPTQVLAATTTISNNSNSIDTSNYHSDPQAMQASVLPSTSSSSTTPTTTAPQPLSSQGNGDFTAQAPLGGPVTFRSTNLASLTAIYEIQFITTTTGPIKKIETTFPSGTIVAFAGVIERVGIGPGALTMSGTTVTYTVTNAVSVPAGTLIRLELVNLINPPTQADYKISVTTRNPANGVIDGPSLSPAYTIRQVSSGMIADGAIIPDVVNVFSATNFVAPQTQGTAFAPCPSTHPHATGGGVSAQFGSGGFLNLQESIGVGSGWSADMFNTHTSTTFSYRTTATCMADMP